MASSSNTINYGSISGVDSQIADSTNDITKKINKIIEIIKYLNKSRDLIGTQKDTPEFRNKIEETIKNTNDTIHQASNDIKRLSELTKKGTKEQKLQVEPIVVTYQENIELYRQAHIYFDERIKANNIKNSVKMLSPDLMDMSEEEQQHFLKQKQLVLEQEHETGLFLEKESRMKSIQVNIINTNQIMKELMAVVLQQSDSIRTQDLQPGNEDRIENNVEDVLITTEQGNRELEKASGYQDKSRKKIFILLAISIAVGVIVTIIIATSIKR